jgi:hypothetical protein
MYACAVWTQTKRQTLVAHATNATHSQSAKHERLVPVRRAFRLTRIIGLTLYAAR